MAGNPRCVWSETGDPLVATRSSSFRSKGHAPSFLLRPPAWLPRGILPDRVAHAMKSLPSAVAWPAGREVPGSGSAHIGALRVGWTVPRCPRFGYRTVRIGGFNRVVTDVVEDRVGAGADVAPVALGQGACLGESPSPGRQPEGIGGLAVPSLKFPD